ncbi:MAG: protein kinase [Ignavibacteriales bacterium]|nr:protein kinase [Ignavibacteriales bacterium]
MIGKTISHYKILEKLGEGGMGVVYKAEDTKLRRTVALKFLPHHLSISNEDNARLLNEAQMTAKLNHPHICTIYDIEEADEAKFIAMEFVDGVTLRTKIKDTGLSIEEAINYAIQIGEALEEAHAKGIIHRDIKPDNIMINSKNQIKVMDFGIAKLKEGLGVTRTMSTSGTVSYMAPEQLSNSKIDGRADIFSLGVLFYEMLSGRLPFRGEHHASMMYSLMNEEPEPINKYLTEVSSEMLHVLNRALEKDPGDRYQHIDDMVSELRRVQKQSNRVSHQTLGETSVYPSGGKTNELTDIEHTTSGIRKTIQSQKRIRLLVGLGIILVLLIAGFIGYTSFFGKHQSIDSIAVLPFENVGADPNTEYLSDGITESLINTLSQLSNLTVMSRSSVFHYKGKDIDPQKIGKELGVKAVLAGRVTQRGDNLQISTELVNVSNNTHIWGEQYNKKLSDILAVQEDISKEISQKLSLKLIDEDEKKLTKRSTENTEAYQLYLKGRYQTSLWTPDGARKGLDYLQRAVELDPDFALGYAGLGKGYYDGSGILFPHTEGMPKAREFLEKALSLDDNLQEAHLYLGVVKMFYDWDWKGAEKEYKRAIELKPNDAEAHSWHAYYRMIIERKSDDALIEAKGVLDLDRRSFLANYFVGTILYYTKQYDSALNQFQNMVDLDIDPALDELYMADCYAEQKRYDEALALLERNATKYGRTNDNLFALGRVYAKIGKKSEAQEIISELHTREKKQFVRALYFVEIYIELGELVHAFDALQKAYEQRDEQLVELSVNPLYDPIRNDPRFKELVKKVGLPE